MLVVSGVNAPIELYLCSCDRDQGINSHFSPAVCSQTVYCLRFCLYESQNWAKPNIEPLNKVLGHQSPLKTTLALCQRLSERVDLDWRDERHFSERCYGGGGGERCVTGLISGGCEIEACAPHHVPIHQFVLCVKASARMFLRSFTQIARLICRLSLNLICRLNLHLQSITTLYFPVIRLKMSIQSRLEFITFQQNHIIFDLIMLQIFHNYSKLWLRQAKNPASCASLILTSHTHVFDYIMSIFFL